MSLAGVIKGRYDSYRLRMLAHGSRSSNEYWERRARHLGARAVVNVSHPAADLEQITSRQKAVLFPLLEAELDGSERWTLDLGCGPGRFTGDLARITAGTVTGVDISRRLLALAQPAEGVDYRWMREGVIPLPDRSVDLVWIVLVLGGITAPDVLRRTISEIDRVLAPGGKLFLVEGTEDKAGDRWWAFRSVDRYVAMFPAYAMRRSGEYVDLGERVSVLVGRKPRAERSDHAR
jgi:SAM-dependent methyltransferase